MIKTRQALTAAEPLLSLNAAWVGLSFMWNSLHVIILPAVMLHYVPETQKNTYLGLLTFLGLVIAMVVQPVAGAVSDAWVSRWGRRRPLILWGTALDLAFLAVLAYAGGLPWLALGYIGLQLSSNVAHGALQGLLPDRVAQAQLGAASGVKNLLDMSGLVLASLFAGRLITPETRQPILAVTAIAGLLILSTAVTLVRVSEAPSTLRRVPAEPGQTSARRPGQGASGAYGWLIGSRFAFLLGIYGIQTFAQYYVRDVLRAANPAQLTGDLLAAITLALLAFVVVGGWLCSRLGGLRVQAAACGVGMLGCLLLLGARTPALLLLFGAVLGVGIGLFLTANWALANELAPAAAAGKFLGLTNLATAGAGAVGRLQGPLIDVLNNAQPGAFWGYTELFVLGALCALASAWLLRRVKV